MRRPSGILVSWCFKPGQTQKIISGLTEIFIKRYTVERTHTEEIRPEEQSEKAESCWERAIKETLKLLQKTIVNNKLETLSEKNKC